MYIYGIYFLALAQKEYPCLKKWPTLLRPRTYPSGFARRLLECFEQHLCSGDRRDLRYKPQIDSKVAPTEVDQFRALPLGDCWEDANLLECLDYLINSKHCRTVRYMYILGICWSIPQNLRVNSGCPGEDSSRMA